MPAFSNPLLTAASVLALVVLPTPAVAQHAGHMPGMKMPAPKKPVAKPKPAAKKPVAKKKASAKRAPAKKVAPVRKAAPPPSPQEPPMNHSQHHEMQQAIPHTQAQPAPAMPPMDHSQMDHSMQGQAVSIDAAPAEEIHLHTAALGPYPMTREASGTAWQPDRSEHIGWMSQSGEWTLMTHGVVNLVADHQSGPRGDDKVFASGMLMGMARRPLGNGTLQLRGGISPDPLMGSRGYPLLLASGETADGNDRLIDRQHPHDFFMELSASLSQNIGPKSSAFLYAGLPGEPAFGPPAFMHREAIMDSPEAPISHHWLDSTHISFGLVTAGVVHDNLKLEVSRFNGREPDEHRWDIETGPLDSTAVRLSWNPSDTLSLQGSWGYFEDPEELEPGVDQKRWSASALYAREVAPGWKLASTLAWGRKTIVHDGETLRDDAFVAEASLKHRGWTMFGRGEIAENRELLDLEEHGPAYRVGKVSLGGVKDVRLAEHLSLGAGGLLSVNFVPDGLAPLYGGHNPVGAMGFLRLKLN